MSENLDLWNKVCTSDPAHTKKVTFGRPITAIDPYQQVKSATEQFGPAGKGWGWEVRDTVILPTNEIGILIRVWHGSPDRYIEQWGQSSFYTDNAESKKDKDCFKKATTDGVTKCLSYIGFNADIFLGQFDGNKYVEGQETKKNPANNPYDDKPWFNDFDDMKAKFEASIKSGERTPQAILDNLKQNFKISKKTKEEILALGGAS